MSDICDSKFFIHLTSGGPRVLRLLESAVPDALMSLAEGRAPDGEEVENIPDWVHAVVQRMEGDGQSWALLPAPTVTVVPGLAAEEPGLTDDLRKSLVRIAEDIASQGPDAETDPLDDLRQGLLQFLGSEEALSAICADSVEAIACGIGHTLGGNLAFKMGFGESESDEAAEDSVRDVYSKVRDKYLFTEELAVSLSPQDPLLKYQKIQEMLGEELAALRNRYYLKTGFVLPFVVIKPFEESIDATSGEVTGEEPPIGAFRITRRRATLFEGSFEEAEGAEPLRLSSPQVRAQKIAAVVETLLAEHAWEWFTFQQLHDCVEELKASQPGLVEEFLASGGTLRSLRRFLVGLLKERISVFDVASYLEFMVDHPGEDGVQTLRARLGLKTES